MTIPSVQASSSVGEIDVIAELVGIRPGSPLAGLRAQRPEATKHSQGSYDALFDPAEVADLTPVERFVSALRVAALHAAPAAAAHYRQRLVATGAGPAIITEAEAGRDRAAESPAVTPRLRAILSHADLLASRPAEAGPNHLQALADAGLSTEAIVTLSQVIAFVSFQIRLLTGLQLIGGQITGENASAQSARIPSRSTPSRVGEPRSHLAAQIIRPGDTLNRPTAFTVEQLEWTPWLEPLDSADATPRQAAVLEGIRGNSPYFRLLARDADVLTERTATDQGIFYTHGGAPRADRELAAAATSRLNGCLYCASVHARRAAQLSKRSDDIDRLLERGVAPGTDLALDERWQGIVDLAVALARTPSSASPDHVARLREIGLTDLEILDIVQATAFFSWANRLMLTLGEPYWPGQDTA